MEQGFFHMVYEVVKQIPYGKVATYGQVAKLVGKPKSARYVGYALHSNPSQSTIPCHRVVNRIGKVSSGFAFGGEQIHKQLLLNEGVQFDQNEQINLMVFGWKA